MERMSDIDDVLMTKAYARSGELFLAHFGNHILPY